jgi:hypothetical protein
VHEITNREDRLEAIAKAYAEQPDRTLVVSPDRVNVLAQLFSRRQSRFLGLSFWCQLLGAVHPACARIRGE